MHPCEGANERTTPHYLSVCNSAKTAYAAKMLPTYQGHHDKPCLGNRRSWTSRVYRGCRRYRLRVKLQKSTPPTNIFSLTFLISRCIMASIPEPPWMYSKPFANSSVRCNRLPQTNEEHGEKLIKLPSYRVSLQICGYACDPTVPNNAVEWIGPCRHWFRKT